jgi:hypothetical protein
MTRSSYGHNTELVQGRVEGYDKGGRAESLALHQGGKERPGKRVK